MSEKHTPEDLAKAQRLADQIKAKVDAALEPLALEMRIMRWKPEFCRIVWEAVMHEAIKRVKESP